MNKVLGIGLIGLGAYGLIRLLRMKNVGDSISTNLVNPRIHKVSLAGISFRTEVAINNPTKDSVKITKPVVTLSTNGKLLSQSNSENKTITTMADSFIMENIFHLAPYSGKFLVIFLANLTFSGKNYIKNFIYIYLYK